MPHKMNHETHTYITVTLSTSSPFLSSPESLAAAYPNLSLSYEGQVGELPDVHLYSIPKEHWHRSGGAGDAEEIVVRNLQESDGVLHVEVQSPRQRVWRGGDEL